LLIFQLFGLDPEQRSLRSDFFNWINVGGLSIGASFVVDQISSVMLLIITGVGSLIHIFSIGYMSHDDRPAKFFSYLNFFVFNMLILVLGASLPVMFVGWEGVGLCSYLLIGFWWKDPAKAAAGMKAFVVNRIGDAALLLGMFLIFLNLNTLEFADINEFAKTLSGEAWVTAAALLLFVGATGKSAQLPLYTWLPDAMAGPTPVSALIHAATMVTAGVYMIVRLNAFYLAAPSAMMVVAIIGGLTAVFAATIGLTQWDIKKILAYSTVSQLGYMFLAVGVGAFGAAMFHLMTHAFFKALMFLGSGSVIHAMHEEQDIRKMGGLKKYLPITHLTFVAGWLAIIGTPLFSGFFSKDEILWLSFHSPRGHFLLWMLGAIGAGLTAFYMTRLMALTFWGKSRVPSSVHPHESPATMTVPLIILAVLSVFGGWIGVPHVIGHLVHIPNILEHWYGPMINPVPGMETANAALEWTMMGISVGIALCSVILAYLLYIKEPGKTAELMAKIPRLYKLVLDKYRVDELYDDYIVHPIVRLSKNLWTHVDVGFIDRATYSLVDFVKATGSSMKSLQSGNLQQYAMYMMVGLATISLMILSAFRG
jgi:NADH-quinone oxidoreductase subunit L